MNRLLEPKPSAPERRRGPRFWQDEEKQSVIVGLVLTFILWWPSLLLFGWAINHIHGKYAMKFTGPAHGRQFNIELAPPVKPPPPPDRFVETNPDAPANIPDQTRNFAAQNQQAAQEKPNPSAHDDHAATQGKAAESTQVVDGHLNPEKPTPPAPPPSTASQGVPTREQNPLSGFDKSEGENKDAIGTDIAKVAESMKSVPKKIEGPKDAPLIENPSASTQQIDPQHPQPRRLLAEQNVRPAIFNNSPGTSRMGVAGWDARWSNYGEYLQKMIETVQAEWDKLLINSGTLPPGGTSVAVTFRLKSDGTVSQIVKVDGNSSDIGQKYCVSAITDRGSYGKWTDDMVAMMGTEQELTFTFYYQ